MQGLAILAIAAVAMFALGGKKKNGVPPFPFKDKECTEPLIGDEFEDWGEKYAWPVYQRLLRTTHPPTPGMSHDAQLKYVQSLTSTLLVEVVPECGPETAGYPLLYRGLWCALALDLVLNHPGVLDEEPGDIVQLCLKPDFDPMALTKMAPKRTFGIVARAGAGS
jgi:hypothetical protein